ncbi:MAG: hypothetical protein RLZZ74_2348 [Cyanobacteriota bacterium]|jgi:hypothetical protein
MVVPAIRQYGWKKLVFLTLGNICAKLNFKKSRAKDDREYPSNLDMLHSNFMCPLHALYNSSVFSLLMSNKEY